MSMICQELAESCSSANENEFQGDDRLFKALVSGCHVENAAKSAGISERTAYRRLADPEFKEKIDQARRSLRESILAKLADAGHDAIAVLMDLMHSAEDEVTRLKAAKAVLDSLVVFQKNDSFKNEAPEPERSRIVLYLPDDGRDPERTARINANGGNLEIR